MKNLLLGSTVIVAIAAGVNAQAVDNYVTTMQAGDLQASDLLGARLNAADFEGDAQAYEDGDAAWSDIGEVSDVLLTRDGAVRAVVLDIGGFLGAGERRIAIPMSDLSFVSTGESADDWRLVADRSRESLEQAPTFDADATAEAAAGDRSMVERMTDGVSSAVDGAAAEAETPVEAESLTAEALTGARVYDANDEDVGEIDSLVVETSGEIDAAVVHVGGLAGLGEHPVRLPFEALRVMKSAEGDEHRVYVDETLESLKAMPAYEG